MKIFSIIFLGLHLALRSVIAEDDNFLVASPFELEEISCPALQCLRKSIPLFPVEEDVRVRDETCRTIARTAFFRDTYHILPIEPGKSVIYSKTSSMEVPTNITDHYRPREVDTNGNTSYEMVFPCMTWDNKAGNFVEIFISRQFSQNQDSSNPFRLVFKQDETSGKLVPIAIAEKPAEVNYISNYDLEELMKGGELGESNTGFICQLTAHMKLRLCRIILNAKKYRDEITFPSYANHEEPHCKKQNIRIHYSRSIRRPYSWYDSYQSSVLVEDRNVTLWAVECQASKKHGRVGFGASTEYFYIIQVNYESRSYYIAEKRNSEIHITDQCHL